MILLDEIDTKEKEKRDSLPPYSPRRSLRLPLIAVPRVNSGVRSFTSTLAQSSLHPRSASVPSATLGQNQSTLTLNSICSTQTLVPSLPTLSPSAHSFSSSTSQLSISSASSLTSLPPHRTYPPRHLRAANNVYVQRDSASVTGAFLIDPTLHVPDCLLPDDPDLLLVRGTVNGISNGKGKQNRSNMCIVTRSGDVCVDIWVREGCARRRRETNGSSNHYGNSQSTRSNLDSQNGSDYWQADWTSPPSSYPWPEKTQARTDIAIRSESGSITVRIHAQSHQRLRIHLSSAHGSISVGIPRYFAGYVQANAHLGRGSTGDSVSSLPRSNSAIYLPDIESDMKLSTGAMGSTSMLSEMAQSLPITPRLPVQFSGEMEDVVTPLSEQRKSARGRYLVGGTIDKLVSERTGSRYLDELNIESRTGAMGVFFNDEPPQQKSDKLITKLLNKAW